MSNSIDSLNEFVALYEKKATILFNGKKLNFAFYQNWSINTINNSVKARRMQYITDKD